MAGRVDTGDGRGGVLCSIEVGLLLGLADVLLVADPLITKPIGYLKRQIHVHVSKDIQSYLL